MNQTTENKQETKRNNPIENTGQSHENDLPAEALREGGRTTRPKNPNPSDCPEVA